MALMYEVNTINAAMIKAAEVCRQDMPEGEKVNAVLACFAGMKPVEAEPVVHARWERCFEDWRHQTEGDKCSACGFEHYGIPIDHYLYCPNCGAKMDGGADK